MIPVTSEIALAEAGRLGVPWRKSLSMDRPAGLEDSVSGFVSLVVNPCLRFILRTPLLHRKLSKSVLLVCYRGRRTGKSYLTPVNYVFVNGALSVLSTRDRVWWRNLRGLPEVALILRGRTIRARPTVIEDPDDAVKALAAHILGVPWVARYLNVGMDAEGRLKQEDLQCLAETRLVIRFEPLP